MSDPRLSFRKEGRGPYVVRSDNTPNVVPKYYAGWYGMQLWVWHNTSPNQLFLFAVMQ